MKTTFHKRRPLTKADFAWVYWSEKEIVSQSNSVLAKTRKTYTTIKSLPHNTRTFENTILPKDHAYGLLSTFLSKVHVLAITSPIASIQKIARQTQTKCVQETVEIEHDPVLYEAIREYKKRAKKLDPDQKKLIDDMMLYFKRMGFDLPEKKQLLVKKNLKAISELEQKFKSNIDDYQDHILVTKKELEGLSDTYIAGLEKVGSKYKVGLSYPEYIPFIEQAKDRKARAALAEKNYKKGGKTNIPLLQKAVALRNENAHLLGYKNHADYVIEDRMAKKVAVVGTFIHDLIKKTLPVFTKEFKELVAFKNKDTGDKNNTITIADQLYYERLLREQTFSLDEESLRAYFPFEYVQQAVFTLFEKVFDIKFKKVSFPVVHPNITWYELHDKQKGLVGCLGLDLYPRPKKYSHMCAADITKPYLLTNGLYNTPTSMMIGNFTKPSKGSSALLSHDEMTTYLHELGHLVHSLVTNARYAEQAGFSVKYDFVEVPSQLFENWCWERDVLKMVSKHHTTGKQLPDDIIKKLQQTQFYREASQKMRQLEQSLLDFELHTKHIKDPVAHGLALRKKLFKASFPKTSIWPGNFGHLMGGYDAGYYGYLWSLVLADDIWTRFEKEGALNKKTGAALREKILAMGGSVDETEIVKSFLGRKPNSKAFLKRFK